MYLKKTYTLNPERHAKSNVLTLCPTICRISCVPYNAHFAVSETHLTRLFYLACPPQAPRLQERSPYLLLGSPHLP